MRLPFYDEKEIIPNFGNTAQRPLPMRGGGVHVAVRFVILGAFAETAIAQGAALTGLRWVGFAASAHAVAKTRVVLCMLRRGGVPAQSSVALAWVGTLPGCCAVRAGTASTGLTHSFIQVKINL